jgi:hypothetical protein
MPLVPLGRFLLSAQDEDDPERRGSYSSLIAAPIRDAAQGRDSLGRPITSNVGVFRFSCILISSRLFPGSSLFFLFSVWFSSLFIFFFLLFLKFYFFLI